MRIRKVPDTLAPHSPVHCCGTESSSPISAASEQRDEHEHQAGMAEREPETTVWTFVSIFRHQFSAWCCRSRRCGRRRTRTACPTCMPSRRARHRTATLNRYARLPRTAAVPPADDMEGDNAIRHPDDAAHEQTLHSRKAAQVDATRHSVIQAPTWADPANPANLGTRPEHRPYAERRAASGHEKGWA